MMLSQSPACGREDDSARALKRMSGLSQKDVGRMPHQYSEKGKVVNMGHQFP